MLLIDPEGLCAVNKSWNWFEGYGFRSDEEIGAHKKEILKLLQEQGATGDIIFAKGDGAISLFIKLFSWSEVNHVGMYQGNNQMSELLGGGGAINSVEDFASRYKDIDVVRPNNAAGEKAADWQKPQIKKGVKYNYWGVIGIYNQTGEHGYICSEFIWHAYNKQGVPLPGVDRDLRVTPGDLYDARKQWGRSYGN